MVNLKEMMMEEREFPGSEAVKYEKYKKLGLEMIQAKKGNNCYTQYVSS